MTGSPPGAATNIHEPQCTQITCQLSLAIRLWHYNYSRVTPTTPECRNLATPLSRRLNFMRISALENHYSAIDDGVYVTTQVQPADIAALPEQGFAWLVNHRPDGEEPGQPSAQAIIEAAEAAGLKCVPAPVRGLPDAEAVAATAGVLKAMQPGEKVLMFCRSGMRSSAAWAMARALDGVPADELRAKAAAAGYDLSRLPL